jgi:hypothetical protein
MVGPERGKEDLKGKQVEQKIMEYKKALFESGLLERIEKERLEIGRGATAHKFDLYPRLTYESNRHSDHFLKELTYLHTKYSVDHAGEYSSFCIDVKADGIYLAKTGKETKKINFEKITDHDIHDWFLSLSKEVT